MQRFRVIDADAAVQLWGLICFSWLLWFTSCFLSNIILDILWARSWVKFRAGTKLNFNLHRCSSHAAGKQQYSVFMLMALIWALKWLSNSPFYRCFSNQSCDRPHRLARALSRSVYLYVGPCASRATSAAHVPNLQARRPPVPDRLP